MVTLDPAGNKTQSLFLSSATSIVSLVHQENSSPETLHTTTSNEYWIHCWEMGTQPEASQPTWSWQDLVGLSVNWLWVNKLARVGAGQSGGLAFHLAMGTRENSEHELIHSKAKGGGCHPGLAQRELAYAPNRL